MRCVEFLAIIPALVFRMCGPFDGDDRRGPVQHLVVIYRGSGCDNSHLEDIVVSNKVSRRHGPDLSHFTWIYRCLWEAIVTKSLILHQVSDLERSSFHGSLVVYHPKDFDHVTMPINLVLFFLLFFLNQEFKKNL